MQDWQRVELRKKPELQEVQRGRLVQVEQLGRVGEQLLHCPVALM